MAMSQLARELHRAAAQRGHLEPLYQELSDQFTRSMQRLYPVWVLIGPGLSDPGHIEIASRQVYLDSEELLGSRQQLISHRLDRRPVLRTFGVALHETFHGKHTKRWSAERTYTLEASDDPDERTLGTDRRLLEEPRMEAHGVRDHKPGGRRERFVREALSVVVVDVLLPRFAQQVLSPLLAGQPVTRDAAGTALTYLHARTLYGAADPAAIKPVVDICRQVLGDADIQDLDALYADLLWVADGDDDALDACARRYRDIIGPPDPPPAGGGDDCGNAGDEPGDGQPGGGPGTPDVRSLSDAIADAQQAARDRQLEQLDEDVSLQELVDHATGSADDADGAEGASGAGTGVGAPTGRMPDRGVDRPPFPDEVAQARRYADALRRALVHACVRIDKRTPGGRFNGRAYARGLYERSHGRPITSRPWEIRRDVAAPVQEPHVGLIVDTSGSMSGYEYALGPICWILSEGLRVVDGRLAIALFGNGMELLSDGAKPLKQVPGIRTGGGTAFGGDAIVEVSNQLDITNARRPRLLYVLSDGGWFDTKAGVEKIAWLREHGVPVLHISIGIEPLSVDADRISVITDPADALGIVSRDTVEALKQASRRPTGRR